MGSYVKHNLISGEEIVYQTKLHWKIFFTLKALLTLFVSPIIQRWTSEFAITNKRIVIKTGLISRQSLEINLSKVESINVEQTFFGRMLGYGTIVVRGTGGTQEPFPNISHPLMFRRRFQETQG